MPRRPVLPTPESAVAAPHTLVIGCGALARELLELTRDLPGVEVQCVDANLHMRPERIAGAVAARIKRARLDHGPDVKLFVAYADCGTRGALDEVLAAEGAERLEGAHCYEVYAGSAASRRSRTRSWGRSTSPTSSLASSRRS